MFQDINQTDLYSTDLYSTDLLSTGYVNIRNMGGFIAMFQVDYRLNGQRISKVSNNIALFASEKIDLPANATNIYVKVSVTSGVETWVPIYNNNLNSTAVIDLELSGTIWDPKYYSITETQKPGAAFKVVNNGAFIIKFNVKYIFNGVEYSLDSGNFYLGMTRNIMLPKGAKNITMAIDMDAIGLGSWSTIHTESFSDIINLVVTLSGTVFAPGIDVQRKDATNTAAPLNSLPVSSGIPMNSNPTNTVQQPVLNNILNDGYVNIRNMGGFIAYFTLRYKLTGKEYNEKSNTIQLFGSEKMIIPRNANDIYIQVSVANMSGEWIPIYNNHLNSSGVIDLELTGTMWNPTYYVIAETQSKAIGSVEILNNGGFIARFNIKYSVNEENFTLKVGKFYLGMVRKIILPKDAKNISVFIEADAIGIGNWSEIYNDTFTDVLNLSITLSGTIWSPGVSVQKKSIDINNSASPLNTTPIKPVITPTPTVKPTCECANNPDTFFKNYMSFMQQMHNEFMKQMKK